MSLHLSRLTSRLSLRCSYSTAAAASSRHDRPFRMAVIGSGPAGFYTSYRVMSLIEGAKVDMYEALPVPFGLVRFGVAPDHPEVKNCEDKFNEVACSPNFTFIGNVAVSHSPRHPSSKSVPLRSLLRHYDAILFAYGASHDRTLGIPGEQHLAGIHSARAFVGWYNGLPEFASSSSSVPDLSAHDEALVIGQGNVALDVARILLADVDSHLRRTDMAGYALDALARSRVRRVTVVGRRGPMQAAFTIKELRELMKLPGVGFDPVEAKFLPPDIKALPRVRRRLMEVLAKGSVTPVTEATKSLRMEFCVTPTAFGASQDEPGRVGFTEVKDTTLSDMLDPSASVVSTSTDSRRLSSPLVFRSIGYKSEPLDEFAELGVAFDQRRGVIVNDGVHGRVNLAAAKEDEAATEAAGTHFPGLYCAGWVKRGPTGVIASTMEDAFTTASAIAADWKSGAAFLSDANDDDSAGWEGVKHEGGTELAQCAVDWAGWKAIDRAERDRGKLLGKERDKLTAIEAMLPLATKQNKQ